MLLGGRSFSATGVDRPSLVAGPTAEHSAFQTSTSTFLSTPDDAELSLGGDSFMLAIVGMEPAVGTYTAWAGNGSNAANEGIRFFGINNNALGMYPGSDGDGTQSAFLLPGARVANTWSVLIWCYDALADLGRFSSSVLSSTISGSGIRRVVPDNDNNFYLNGGASTASYRSVKNIAYAGMWRRPATQGFSEAELTAVRGKLVALKLTA